LVLLVQSISALAQVPQVKLIDHQFSSPSQVVSLTGANFGTDPTKVAVYFGGAKGTITSITDQLLEAQTPMGTTFDKINVVNTTSGLGSFSRESFFLDFGGTHGFDATKMQGQFDFSAGSGLYDHCLCDFDNDGKLDVATANESTNSITLFRNNSTVGSYSFTQTSPSVGTVTVHARCGDLNGDGLSDLVVSEGNGGNRIFVFRNTGAFSFNLSTITITGKKVKRLEIADLDGDGKPEIIISDQGAPDVIILQNFSTTSTITFGAPIIVPVTGVASTDGLSIEDLNGDYLPEIITSQFLTAAGNVTILKNQSVVGTVNMGSQVSLALPGTLVNIKVGDLDGDRLPEIVATQLLGSGVSIFLNKSSSTIQYAAPQTFVTDTHPWGLDFGDLDGDGKLDIVTASVTNKSLTVLNNTSTAGSLSFQKTILPTTYINRHVKIADMDGDGKPDITFTSVDDVANSINSSKVSIFRNASCMTPVVLPGGPLTICTGFPLQLNATVNGGATYQWYSSAVAVPAATTSNLSIIATGLYTITATAEAGACVTTSNAVNITVGPASALAAASPTNNGPVCLNGTLQLNVADVGATQYLWRGPASYSGSGLAPAAVTNFAYSNAGKYILDVYSGTCLAQETSTVVDAVAFPNFTISSPASTLICQGQTATLSLVPSTSNVSYQWYEKTSGIIAGQTSSSFVASLSGNYFGEVTSTIYPACPPAISDTLSMLVVSLPVPNFSVPSSLCTGQNITFTNQSTTDPQTTPVFSWDFGDTNTSTAASPVHSYTNANTYTVKLTASYTGGICTQSNSQPVTVQAAPPLAITSSSGAFSFCSGSPFSLQASAGFSTYQWSNSASTQSINVTIDGTYSVTATAPNSCVITASQAVTTFPLSVITISATPPLVDEGKPSQLVASGLVNYMWTPGKTLSDSTIANPTATPLVSTLFKVTGKDSNGCVAKDSITVNVKGESVTSKLNPQNFISPGNGDTINEKWIVENIETYPQCGVTIYDEKGLKVYDSKPYANNWDGTYNGHLLPIGAYYYIIRCDGDNTPKTGSITLVR